LFRDRLVAQPLLSGDIIDPSNALLFHDSMERAPLLQIETGRSESMSRLSFFVLIVIGLTLTAYFATEAWRLSDSDHLEITNGISHR
jgi:hypothetical protein